MLSNKCVLDEDGGAKTLHFSSWEVVGCVDFGTLDIMLVRLPQEILNYRKEFFRYPSGQGA